MVSSPEDQNTLFSLWSLSYNSPFIPNNTMDDINFCSSEYILSRRSDQIMSRIPLCTYVFSCRLFKYWHIHTELVTTFDRYCYKKKITNVDIAIPWHKAAWNSRSFFLNEFVSIFYNLNICNPIHWSGLYKD